jgi:diguanylate cyclase (GGDEF)-like protein/PAS domain S-box-containing protein
MRARSKAASFLDAEPPMLPLAVAALSLIAALLLALARSRRSLRAAERREAHYRALFERSPVMMHSVDRERRLLSVNDAWLATLGYTRAEVLGRDSSEFLTPESRRRALETVVPRFIQEGSLRDVDYQMQTRSGEIIDVQLSAIWETDAEGRPLRTLSVLKDVTEARRLAQRMAHLAHHDALTGLPNRVLFQDRVQLACDAARGRGGHFAVVFMDLDHFKNVNDSLGHALGDRLLTTVSARLAGILRGGDTVCRLGGDEFVMLLPELADAGRAGEVAERILDTVAQPCWLDGTEVRIGVSLGIAMYPQDGADPATLMKRADTAMYRAKREGRNRFHFHSLAFDHEASVRLQLEAGLRRGLAEGHFRLHYQPVVDAHRRQLVGVEALVRWERDGHGLQGPASFIPVAEETGFIVPLGQWILRRACEQLRDWAQAGAATVPMAVNVSPLQLAEPGFADRVAQTLQATGVDGAQLVFEITESALARDPQASRDALLRIKALGIRVAVDDFGTGHSSLAHLRRFPVDTLKIDRAFVRDLETDADSREIVRAMLALAQSLRLQVVAEGVETEAQARWLAEMACPALQGYLFGRPVEPVRIAERLARRSPASPAEPALRLPA